MEIRVREMTEGDYEQVFAIWQVTSKRALSEADSFENISAFLRRNPGLSQVAEHEGKIIGSALAGHDGRRGFFYHLSVSPEYRRFGAASHIVKKILCKFSENGITKANIFCYCDNETGQSFWREMGFEKRNDILVFSKPI